MNAAPPPLLPLLTIGVPRSLLSLFEQEGVPFRDEIDNARAGRFILFDSLQINPPSLAEDQVAIDLNDVRCRLGFDPFGMIESGATSRAVWKVGPWEATEEIADVDRAAIRAAVMTDLRRTIEGHGGVWMRIGAMPAGFRSAFCFRFDHDAFVADDFAAVCGAIAGREAMTTHFVCASTHQAHRAELQRLQGYDVGSHGYYHHTYRSFDENVVNIQRGVATLESLGFAPSGFAAPHGRYHAAIAAAMARCGISHSSEFSAAYDDAPFFGGAGDAVQIPIHPVCLGIVLEAVERVAPGDTAAQRRAADDVAEYFIDVARRKRANRAPIFLYGHPDGRLGRYPHVLRNLLDEVSDWSDVWKTNFTAFQQWWRERRAMEFAVHHCAAGYEIRRGDTSRPGRAVLEWITDDGIATTPLDQPTMEIRREALTFERSTIVEVPKPLRREPTLGLKERLRRALDWEYATPVAEIDARRWRGKIKRTLRRWKEPV